MNLPVRQQKKLLGNSLLLPVVIRWFVYTISNTAPNDLIGDLPKSAEVAQNEGDADAEQEELLPDSSYPAHGGEAPQLLVGDEWDDFDVPGAGATMVEDSQEQDGQGGWQHTESF